MSLFERKKTVRMELPEGFSKEDIKIESSVCTGERTIGFYSKSEKKLFFAELVKDDGDIAAFYEKYGLER